MKLSKQTPHPSKAAAQSISTGKGNFQLKDNRKESIAQQKSIQLLKNSSVAQLALRDDLENETVNMALVGEHHNEISPAEEINEWKRVGVKVHYEADEISHKTGPGGMLNAKTTPDPPILRATFLWRSFNVNLRGFWRGIIDGENIPDLAMTVEDIQNMYGRILDEVVEIGPIAPEVIEMEEAVKDMIKLLPPSSDNLGARDHSMKKIIGQAQLSNIAILDQHMKEILKQSSFKDTGYDKDSLMIERSRQMILNANKIASGVKKMVYKVGDEHVQDMGLLGIAPAGGMKVLNRSKYLGEYGKLKEYNSNHQASGGNGLVFGQIGNEQL